MISRSQDGYFYTYATINNIPVKFMIDTGASDIALTKEDAKKLKFDLANLKYTRSYSTVNGTNIAAPVTLNQFKISNKLFKKELILGVEI